MPRLKKHTKEVKDSIFWKPESFGECVEGIFSGYQQTDKSKCIVLALKAGGQKFISISAVLLSFLLTETKDVPLGERLREGKDKIKIVYIAKAKRARLFRVWVNDVEQEQVRSYKKISAKDVLSVDKSK